MSAPRNDSSYEQDPLARVSVLLVMLFLLSSLIIRSFADVVIVAAGYGAVTAKNLSALVGFGVLAMLMCPLIFRIWHALRQQFQWPAFQNRSLLAAVALGMTFWIAEMLSLALLTPMRWIGSSTLIRPAYPDYSISCDNPLTLLLAIPVTAFITPVCEEVIHRAIIFRALLQKGRAIAILSSSALFAIVHPPAAMASAFVFGIFFAIQYLHYRTVWAPIITHGVANLMIVVSGTCIDAYWNPGRISWSVTSPVGLVALSIFACFVIAWWLSCRIQIGTGSSRSVPT